MSHSTLSSSDTAERLLGSAFVHEGDTLHASFDTEDFASATNFVDHVARAADAANHHPDIHLSYGSVGIELSSHDVGGVTDRDLSLAVTIEKIADELGAAPKAEHSARQ